LAIELRPFDFLHFFPEFQGLLPAEFKKIKILDANRTLETYLKREADSLTLILETEIDKLRDTAFHMEVQTSYDDTIDKRVLVYNVLIRQKTKKAKVKTLLINLDPDTICQLLGHQDFGTVKIDYKVTNLWEQSYEEIKPLLGLLPFTPYLKGGGKPEIREASEIITEKISAPQERSEMLFLLAILAGRKYKTAGFHLLSPSTIMSIESLRNDPTAKQLIELLYPEKLTLTEAFAQGEVSGIEKGIEKGKKEGLKKATENFVHRFSNLLSEEQIKQLLTEAEENLTPTGK
jgi:hypothetical protein